MGFRCQSGTRHLVQLLDDLIGWRSKHKMELWLASFDVEKCYDTLPCWALFGMMRQCGMPLQVVQCFEDFHRRLRRRFRYGQVDGELWQACNGAPQGDPASPDLLNLLLEPFHRWARAEGLGVGVAGSCIPSVSFADDLVLVGGSRKELETLISAYLSWCDLLGLRVTKVQVWWNGQVVRKVKVADREVPTEPFFKVVGVTLGGRETLATAAHLERRLPKAMATVQRLRAVTLPASICALLWRTVVLPQALYGCEVRNVRPTQLQALGVAGRAMLAAKHPLNLNSWRAPEVLSGPPFGESAIRDPVFELRLRQLCWLHLLVNMPGMVGTIHGVGIHAVGLNQQFLCGQLCNRWAGRCNGT